MQIGNSQWKTLIYNQYFIKYSYFSHNMKRETARFYFQAHFCTYKKLGKNSLSCFDYHYKICKCFLASSTTV